MTNDNFRGYDDKRIIRIMKIETIKFYIKNINEWLIDIIILRQNIRK